MSALRLLLLALLLAPALPARAQDVPLADSLATDSLIVSSDADVLMEAVPRGGVAEPYGLRIVVDPSLSAETGARSLIAARAGIAALEDRLLPLRFGSERRILGKVLGVVYRTLRLSLVDSPVETLAFLAQHEVFGHGARCRQSPDFHQAGYGIDLPPPYGLGGGFTSCDAPDGYTTDNRGLLSVSGSNASTVLADDLLGGAVQRGQLGYRDALLYVLTATDAANYVLASGGDGETVETGNDADAWRASLNVRARRLGIDQTVTTDEAHTDATTAYLDPMLYVSLYALFKGYLYSGAPSVRVPMLRVGSARYLPAVRFGWSPYGGDVLFDQRVVRGERTALLRLRWTAPAIEPAWGASASVTRLARVGSSSVDGSVDVWSQPALLLGTSNAPLARGGGIGGAVRATAHIPIRAVGGRTGLVVEAGWKTVGFVGAESIEPGLILRAGLSLRPR